MGDADFLRAHVHNALLTCEIGVVSTVPGWAGADVDVDVVLRPHEVALTPQPARSGPGERWCGGRVPRCLRAAHGPAGVRPDGPFVAAALGAAPGRHARPGRVVPGITPTLLVGDHAMERPPAATSHADTIARDDRDQHL